MCMIEGTGCDLVKISRIDRYLDQLETRILSQADRRRAAGFSRKRRLEFAAGRFALKESLVKAFHGTRTAGSFLIETGESGQPVVVGESLRNSCSVSHDGEYAMAWVVVES